MNFDLAEDISSLLADNKMQEAIDLAELNLKEQPPNGFQQLLQKDLRGNTDKLVDFISNFYNKVKGRLSVKAIYAEMNGFTINYGLWYLDLFAYDEVGTMDDMDWLADWEKGNSTTNGFPIKGFEDLQATYKDYMENERYNDSKMEAASEVAELLIVLRFQELLRSAVQAAEKKGLAWCKIPIFASAHDYDDLTFQVNK